MVLRRSTTRWTWPSDFNNSERSTVTFIAQSVALRARTLADDKRGVVRRFRQGRVASAPPFLPFFPVFSQAFGKPPSTMRVGRSRLK
jgi:hypothetical protein